MALCLRKQFISCGSFAFVGRRNHQTSCFEQKISNASPHSKEVIPCDYLPVAALRNCRTLRMRASVQACPNNLPRMLDTNSVCYNKDIKLDFCTVREPNALGLDDSLMYCISECTASKSDNNPAENETGKPTEAQLQFISDILSKDLPKLFVRPMDYRIYHPQFIFENNIRGTKSKGLVSYISEIALLKLVGHLKFAQVHFKVLKLTTHPEDGTIRVRWRIVGVSNYQAFFQFWKHKPGGDENTENWFDGFSIFYVRSDGLVHKHTVDKMMPDSEGKVATVNNNLAAKMAFAVGLILEDFSTLYLKEIPKEHPEVLLLLKQLDL